MKVHVQIHGPVNLTTTKDSQPVHKDQKLNSAQCRKGNIPSIARN